MIDYIRECVHYWNTIGDKILVTGGYGFLGRNLQKVLPNAVYISSYDCDLRNIDCVENLFFIHKPEYIIHLASKVGGVGYNFKHLGEMYYDNVLLNSNILEVSRRHKVKKLLSVLSTCIYPNICELPLKEENIHKGEPHFTNFGYAYAKRMLDVQSRSYRKQYGCNFVTVVPNNLIGKYDKFDLNNSHVVPAIIRKIYEARENNQNVVLWGDGTPLREFTCARDICNIILFLMKDYDGEFPINIGNTEEISIKDLAKKISKLLGFKGKIVWDKTKPNGQHRKPSDNSKLLNLGWKKENYTSIDSILERTIKWFLHNYPENIDGVSK